MAKKLPLAVQDKMWEQLESLQQLFPYTEEGFLMFANYNANELIKGSPDITRTQADLCKYLFHNGIGLKVKKKNLTKKSKKKKAARKNGRTYRYKYKQVKTGIGKRLRMIQANRGLGKTTFCAIYAVFRIIHDPTTRVLIFSAGGKLSKEIANWIIQIIEGLEILHFLRPDKQNGDRASMEAYDIHWLFRGAEKAPSVKCLGVDSNAQGSRADLVIADDIESMKNSRTTMMRELLVELTKEFESICQDGDIVYLGTPQFFESIYNQLPYRGYDMRIWTARYPTVDMMAGYNGHLAPMLMKDIEDDPSLQTGYGLHGDQGKPTCPEMFDDENLTQKEISQGASKFQLQFMLNTRLADLERYPLKASHLIVAPFNDDVGIVSPLWTNDERCRLHLKLHSNQSTDRLYSPFPAEYETRKWERSLMYIDPAGGGKNGDETGYAVIRTLGAFVYIQALGGVTGGFEEEKMRALVAIAKRHHIKDVYFEKNFGNGAFQSMIQPYFETEYPVTMHEHWATGQKELRIVDTIEPFLSSHRLVIHPDVIRQDVESTERYADDVKMHYSALYQMSMLTRDKDCLVKYDRLDALAGAIHQVSEQLAFDTETEMNRRRFTEVLEWMKRMKNPQQFREDVPINDMYYNTRGLLGSKFSANGW